MWRCGTRRGRAGAHPGKFRPRRSTRPCPKYPVFKVISAIFVQSAMHAAEAVNRRKSRERLLDSELLDSRVYILLHLLFDASSELGVSARLSGSGEQVRLSEQLREVLDMQLEASKLDKVLKTPEAIAAIEDLDIDQADYPFLKDIPRPQWQHQRPRVRGRLAAFEGRGQTERHRDC